MVRVLKDWTGAASYCLSICLHRCKYLQQRSVELVAGCAHAIPVVRGARFGRRSDRNAPQPLYILPPPLPGTLYIPMKKVDYIAAAPRSFVLRFSQAYEYDLTIC